MSQQAAGAAAPRGAHGALDQVWRQERARVVATVARRLGDLQLAEDAVQEAFAAAAARWPTDGVPERPGAWLTTTAWRKALDVLRRERFPVADPARDQARDDLVDAPAGEPGADGLAVQDDLLGLLLACAHPALSLEARVALTLRHVCGLTAREIAAAFLVAEATMDKRLVRARAKVRDARISFAVPDRAELPERLAGAGAVIYLVFTEGHLASGAGPPVRTDLCEEALWLARQLHALAPGDPETTGLFALLLLQHARTPARRDDAGALVPYAEQDRGKWDTAAIEQAKKLLATTTATGSLGPYQLQAAIALLHATAPDAERVNWARIADLYGVLARLAPAPVVTVNRAVAVGRADGPPAGLALLTPVLAAGDLERYPPLHAAHADLLERAGRPDDARSAWRRAADLTANPAQRAELDRRAATLAAPSPQPGPDATPDDPPTRPADRLP